MGMSYHDFALVTPSEFQEAVKAKHEWQAECDKAAWERMRILASIAVQPHIKKRLTPQELLPLPWDNEQEKPPTVVLSKQETADRIKELQNRIKRKENGERD